MKLVIDDAAFRRLSAATQNELLEALSGREVGTADSVPKINAQWDAPVNLTTRLAANLVSNLTDDHRKRLRLLAKQNGRATMKELLAVTGDKDWHVLSQFQGVITRRLRRLIGDTEKKATLIEWDYDSTKWDKSGANIVDGVYFVTKKSAKALQRQF